MKFRDVVHGAIDFGTDVTAELLEELVHTPEVQRLRFMRMLNQDAMYMQELATARRFAHAVGTCHTALQVARRSGIGQDDVSTIAAAALLHDIGIHPYGHLVETELRRRDPDVSHESLVRQLIFGTYHPLNLYHQILPARSLRVAAVLQKFGVSADKLISLVSPDAGGASAIAGPMDFDNIDNVHRMAALLGYSGAAENLRELVGHLQLGTDLSLAIAVGGLAAARRWLDFRELIYTQMIGHPSCVAYNAYLQDLVREAVKGDVVTARDWWLSDVEFEQKVEASEALRELAIQQKVGCLYSLIDYAWIEADPASAVGSPEQATLGEQVVDAIGPPPSHGLAQRVWVERDKTTRQLTLEVGGRQISLGRPSLVVLVALINPGIVAKRSLKELRAERGLRNWRKHVASCIREQGLLEVSQLLFPEDIEARIARRSGSHGQLSLL
ncbi:MAG: HD domain-containing protein [Proteobacteria bacterium]|nr:HD domain-containing protein [Pseudomonadota bacterium]